MGRRLILCLVLAVGGLTAGCQQPAEEPAPAPAPTTSKAPVPNDPAAAAASTAEAAAEVGNAKVPELQVNPNGRSVQPGSGL